MTWQPEDDRHGDDGLDRRGFLKCMAWAGTGVLFSVAGGVLRSQPIDALRKGLPAGELHFVQISDSHIGFSKEANNDVTGTLKSAIDRINALPSAPEFIIHTGDLTHLARPEEFDTLGQILGQSRARDVFYVPGEHDVLGDNGALYRERHGKGTIGDGWYSFDHGGVHFIGLVNVLNLKAGGLGLLGPAQLEWLERDLKGLSSSTPIVIFAHIPLWSVYPEWGWGTDDSARALSYLRRFGSVAVLNGHIHQVMQKVEGHITFHTAMSTAFPQPRPGEAPSPGPMKVPPDRLRGLLGITSVEVNPVKHRLAIIDSPLTSETGGGAGAVSISNFKFTPQELTVPVGTSVTWTNHDDSPHTVVSTEGKFSSKALDTDDAFTFRFVDPGAYKYYCSMHKHMTGVVNVR